VWPSGDFTVGHAILDRPDKSPSILEGITTDGTATYYIGRRLPTQVERLVDEYTALEKLGRFDECIRIIERLAAVPELPEGFIEGFRDRQNGQAAMGLSVVSNSRKQKFSLRKPRGRGGLAGITPEAKRMVRSGCVLLERFHARGELSFFTGTLPSGLLESELLLCSQNASYLTERFVEEVRRELARHGLETDRVITVIEIQGERYEKFGEICIHIHSVFPNRKAGCGWFLTVGQAEDIWCRQVETLIGRPVDRRAMTQIEKVRKPVGNEMGKYLSKAAKASRAMVEKHPDFIPKSWVFIPQAFRREIKAAVEVYRGNAVTVLMDSLDDLQKAGILKFRPICVEVEGRTITVGHVGFTRSGFTLNQFLCDSRAELLQRVEFLTGHKLRRISSVA
jgi:hypothetical protein